MYVVYILFSLEDQKLYIGFTSDLSRRLRQHRLGEVKSTKKRRPLTLIHYEVYSEKADAERRELYLKGGNGRKTLKVQLYTKLKSINYKYL